MIRQPIADQIWNMKYRLKMIDGTPIDQNLEDTWFRIAIALSEAEAEGRREGWQARFYEILEDFKFIPAGRIVAGAGTDRSVTLFNCFVMGTIPDSIEGIFQALKEAALTMQQGGGIGYDFSTIRPKGALVKGVAADASGPLSFMDCWDSMCRTILSAGSRRGAMMATMRCDHPEIEAFIEAKRDPLRLRMFNLSVLVTDPFMEAVRLNQPWRLHFEDRDGVTLLEKTIDARGLWDKIMHSTYRQAEPGVIFIDRINQLNNLNYCEIISSTNPCFAGDEKVLTADGPKTFLELEGKRVSVLTENRFGKLVYRPMNVFKTAMDQELLLITLDDGTKIKCTHTHEFFDLGRNRIEARDLVPGQRLASVYRPNHKVISVEPLAERQDVFCGTVEETHKFFLACDRGGILVSNCGEQPLPPYGACLLGSMNTTKYIFYPFQERAEFDYQSFCDDVRVAIRMMDNVIDVSKFPLDQQAVEARAKRRLGLGITGLADALIMLNLVYGDKKAVRFTEHLLRMMDEAAYAASVDLAKEKGAFPLFDAEKFLAAGTHASNLNKNLQESIRKYGIRNALLTSIAPTGTISLYAGNVSSGIEPVFAYAYTRKVLQPDGSRTEEQVSDYAWNLYMELHEGQTPEGPQWVSAQTLLPKAHIAMQAAAQKWIDSSISKTINLPKDISFTDFEKVYMDAWNQGCKGCTTYRPNDITGSILSVAEEPKAEPVSEKPELVTAVFSYDEPMERPDMLLGATYKIKWPNGEHAFYINITDIADDQGHRRPFEIFINSKSMEHFQWTVGLTRMISAVFRRPHDSTFVVEELRSVFDPKGGAWMGGKYVPSILAAIGNVIERHMLAIGYIQGVVPIVSNEHTELDFDMEVAVPPGPCCLKCNSFNVKKESGCFVCKDCGESTCG